LTKQGRQQGTKRLIRKLVMFHYLNQLYSDENFNIIILIHFAVLMYYFL